jgi:hypothetical protein
VTDGILSDDQREMVESLKPRRRLRDRVVAFLSGSFPLPGLADVDVELLARHLEESARRAVATEQRQDMLMFRMASMEEAAWSTPAVDMVRAIAAAARVGAGEVPVVPDLDTAQKYGVSALLEAAQGRALRESVPYMVGAGCGRLWQAWDAWAGVSGSPAERSWHLAGRPRGVVVRD